uniref:Uncharacterized protein n=1 Tax=Glossina austeni TaxID=7395 RepID=A0A1A9UR58_GLOAU
MNDIIRLYPDGNPLFKMPNLKLVKLDKLIVSKSDSKAPLQLNFQLFDIKITGLDKAKVLSANGFEKDSEYHEVEFQVPFVKMNARYEINGKLLLLPVKGTGHGVFTHKGLHVILKHKIALQKRNGKNYIKTIKLWTPTKPENSTYEFGNLFDGNKVLADATNKVLTENSQNVWSAMGEEFSRGIAQVIEELVLPTLECLAYDDFFAE